MERLPPLAEVPLEALDPAFEARVRAAPHAEQDRMLAEADLLRVEEDDASSWRALTVYRALVGRLEERGPIHLDRAAWTASEDPARDAVVARLARVALEHPGENEQIEAACTLAACEWMAGDFTGAEQRLTTLLPRVRGREDSIELNVYHALASLYASQRRELESLALARRAQALSDRRPQMHPVHHAHATSVLADAYRSLDDAEGLAAAAERMLAISARMSEPDGCRLRRQAHTIAHEAAMLRGDLPTARDRLASAQLEHSRDLKTSGHHESSLAYYEARLALRLGNLPHVAALVDVHREKAQTHPTLWLLWNLIAVEAWARQGQRTEAIALATATLERMAEPAMQTQLGTGRRLRHAQHLGELLEDPVADPALAALAFREAADAAFDRLGELERCDVVLPEVGEPTAEDRDALARYRKRFHGRHRIVLDHLGQLLLEARRRGELPAWANAAPGGMTAVCAWCRSVRDAEGRWLPLGHFVGASGPAMTVTHGICDACREGTARKG